MIRYDKFVIKCPICGEPYNSSSLGGACPDCVRKANEKDKRNKTPWGY